MRDNRSAVTADSRSRNKARRQGFEEGFAIKRASNQRDPGMDEQMTGVANQGLGRLQDGIGGLTGNDELQAKGKLKEAVGSVQQAFGEAKSSVQDAFEDTLEGVRGQVHEQLNAVETYVVSKPLPAVAIAGAIGIVLGLLLRGRSKTIYLRDAR